MHVFPYVCLSLSLCLSVSLSLCLSVSLSLCLSVSLSLCLSVSLSLCLSVSLSLCLSVSLSLCLSVSLSLCLSLSLSLYQVRGRGSVQAPTPRESAHPQLLAGFASPEEFFQGAQLYGKEPSASVVSLSLSVCLSVGLSVGLFGYTPACVYPHLSLFLSPGLRGEPPVGGGLEVSQVLATKLSDSVVTESRSKLCSTDTCLRLKVSAVLSRGWSSRCRACPVLGPGFNPTSSRTCNNYLGLMASCGRPPSLSASFLSQGLLPRSSQGLSLSLSLSLLLASCFGLRSRGAGPSER